MSPSDAFVRSALGGAKSRWDHAGRRALVTAAYRLGETTLMRAWDTDDEDGLAMALGRLRARLGY